MTAIANTKSPPRIVIGPQGMAITLASLPPPGVKRWVSNRKAVVVTAVNAGLLSMQEACKRYDLSPEEFLAWKAAFAEQGMYGLRATRRRGGPCRKDMLSFPSQVGRIEP